LPTLAPLAVARIPVTNSFTICWLAWWKKSRTARQEGLTRYGLALLKIRPDTGSFEAHPFTAKTINGSNILSFIVCGRVYPAFSEIFRKTVYVDHVLIFRLTGPLHMSIYHPDPGELFSDGLHQLALVLGVLMGQHHQTADGQERGSNDQ
jgi:hypothetical protein